MTDLALAFGLILGLLSQLTPTARASETTAADASIVATHGSPTGAVVPQPTMPPEFKKPEEEQPFALRLILHPRTNGMLITLPIIDTDPNRGVTFGLLPVWIINSSSSTDERIVAMHAPSLVYNPTFKSNFTYRYFYYPTKDSTLTLRGSMAQVVEKEAFLQYDNLNLFDEFGEWGIKTQYNIDASNRFYGLGPATNKSALANYALYTMATDVYFGLPFHKGSDWYWTVEHRLIGNKVDNGPVKSVAQIGTAYPSQLPAHWHQTSAFKGFITYDTLDNSITTTKGTYAEFFVETSQKSLASEYVFQRYSVDLRHFLPWSGDDTFVTAARYKFEQVVGDGVPFWLMPYLGGKYTFPAYGDGRYTDLGVMAVELEERIAVLRLKTGGMKIRFEVSPFTGAGTAFPTPGQMTARLARPLFGLGLRAVAPPQVVGSIDVGIGQEGVSTFMDINYPF